MSTRPRILLIDNYDSFTYNLVQAFLVLGAEVDVHRNDAISVEAALCPGALASGHLAGARHAARCGSVDADDRGIRGTHSDLRRMPRSSVAGRGVRRAVVRAARLMHGKVSPVRHDGKGVFSGMAQDFQAGRYHSLIAEPESISAVLEVTARTPQGEIMGVRHRSLPIEGVQFHPESVLTPEGPVMMGNFLKM